MKISYAITTRIEGDLDTLIHAIVPSPPTLEEVMQELRSSSTMLSLVAAQQPDSKPLLMAQVTRSLALLDALAPQVRT